MALDRAAAVDRVLELVETVEDETLPVPVREVWVYGDVALGIDPVERLDVYLTKDVLLGDDSEAAERFAARHGVEGVGSVVRAEWAREHPDAVRTNAAGYAAPERCLAAHLCGDDEPIHLEVCNASFEDNVTQRLEGARASGDYESVLDPRGVCLWIDGRESEGAVEKLRSGSFAFPPLAEALSMLGLEDEEAARAAAAVENFRDGREGTTVRGDVV